MSTWSYKATPELSDEQYARWQVLLEERTGICFMQHKSILQKGLRQRMSEVGAEDYEQYFQQVSAVPEGVVEWAQLVDKISVKRRIVKLKDQLVALMKAKDVIEECVNKTVNAIKKQKEEEISDLFDSYCPFLSLGHPILSYIMKFGGAESLYCCEKASYTLAHVIDKHDLWEDLAVKWKNHMPDIYFDQKVHDTEGRLARTRRFKQDNATTNELTFQQVGTEAYVIRNLGSLANRARELERLGEKHYDYRQDLVYALNINCSGCNKFHTGSNFTSFSGLDTFLRVSVWDESSQTHYATFENYILPQSTWETHMTYYISPRALKRWPKLDEYSRWRGKITNDDQNLDEKIEKMKSLARDLRVTFFWGSERQQLSLATGGFHSPADSDSVWLHPRIDGRNELNVSEGHITSIASQRLVKTKVSFLCTKRVSLLITVYRHVRVAAERTE